MSASIHCHHPELDYSLTSEFAPGDERRIVLMLRAARCIHCDKRWRFVGVSPQIDPFGPTSNQDATRLALPMVEIAG